MKKLLKLSFLLIVFLVSCTKKEYIYFDENGKIPNSEFELKNYFVAGIFGDKNSVYAIQFLEKGKAIWHFGTANYVGTYKLENKILNIEINEEENKRIFKFHLNAINEIKFSYSQSEYVPYFVTGKLLKNPDENQFVGKTFQGSELKHSGVGASVFKEKWYYTFGTDKKMGTGEVKSDIIPNQKIEFLNNAVFRVGAEMGYIDGDIFFTSSERTRIFYSGVYNLVK